jgi:uncharacterized protein (DUF1330 family)
MRAFNFSLTKRRLPVKRHVTLGLAMVVSAALGAAAVETLHAQAKPPAYTIAQVNVKDPDGYKKDFLPVVMKGIEAAGAKYIVRGGKTESFSGEPPPNRVAVLQFESLDKAKAWWKSPANQEANKIGEKYADFRVYAIEGLAE